MLQGTQNLKKPVTEVHYNNQAKKILKSSSNNDTHDYQGGVGKDDSFFWKIDRVVQYFNSVILSPTFESTLHRYEIDSWILL
jgi:hypothetical protein